MATPTAQKNNDQSGEKCRPNLSRQRFDSGYEEDEPLLSDQISCTEKTEKGVQATEQTPIDTSVLPIVTDTPCSSDTQTTDPKEMDREALISCTEDEESNIEKQSEENTNLLTFKCKLMLITLFCIFITTLVVILVIVLMPSQNDSKMNGVGEEVVYHTLSQQRRQDSSQKNTQIRIYSFMDNTY